MLERKGHAGLSTLADQCRKGNRRRLMRNNGKTSCQPRHHRITARHGNSWRPPGLHHGDSLGRQLARSLFVAVGCRFRQWFQAALQVSSLAAPASSVPKQGNAPGRGGETEAGSGRLGGGTRPVAARPGATRPRARWSRAGCGNRPGNGMSTPCSGPKVTTMRASGEGRRERGEARRRAWMARRPSFSAGEAGWRRRRRGVSAPRPQRPGRGRA